jgi:hypothetical protein
VNHLQTALHAIEFNAGECVEWTGHVGHGYGLVRVGGKERVAHKVIYEMLVGPVPNGLQLDHLCRNKLCVNHEHLEPVTQSSNMRRVAGTDEVCRRGHPRDVNTYTAAVGHSRCRRCNTIAVAEYAARKKAAQR